MTESRSDDERPESGDSAQTLRNRLAALDGLHADGHLTDEEHRVARQMAISGPVGPTAPVVPTGKGGALPPQASSPSDGPEREGRHPLLLPVVAGVLIAVVIALIAVLVFAIGGDSTSQPSEASTPATDGITDVELGDPKGARKGLGARATPAPTTTASASSAPSSSGTGAAYDIVDYSGGEGVRYRYSTRMSDLVPGNGPMEGDQVTIFCYLTGERVRGNPYWALVDQIEGYVVPATYLRYGHNGPPAGVAYC